MADSKTKQDGRDDARVDINDSSEVEYLHQQHPEYSHQQIVDAVKNHGPLRSDIEASLKR